MRAFWKDNGFNLVQDRADAGVLETDWAENRAKLPHDIIRGTIGKLIDSVYSTGELDKFRTRIERTATGSDIYVTHRGMEEVYTNSRKDQTVWQARPADPQLEATFLSRMMIKLGAKDEQAKTVTASARPACDRQRGKTAPARRRRRARASSTARRRRRCSSTTTSIAPGAGSASPSTEAASPSRTATAPRALYFVRYVDPAFAGREEPNFFSRMLNFGKKDETGLAKYRIKVSAEGNLSTVAVFDSAGKPETTANGKRIVTLLLEDLR